MKISKLSYVLKNFEKKTLASIKKGCKFAASNTIKRGGNPPPLFNNQLKSTTMKAQEFGQKKQNGELIYHHTSVSRGYVAVDGTWYEDYQGRFGKGVIEHQETLHSAMKGNSHHFIHYYIYK